jgi:pyridoxamine 5'-phosphate oxidase
MEIPDLNHTQAEPDPIALFRDWFSNALAANLPQPEAMTLATATRTAQPSARMVLLRGIDERGFVFHTNYESRKGQELAENPSAAAILFWQELRRQIRLEGSVEKISPRESDAYFNTRERGSKLAAWASEQSQVIENRQILESRVQDIERKYADREIPRPPNWGGYRLRPNIIEFWQGRPNRLHDRLRYSLQKDGTWLPERLAP